MRRRPVLAGLIDRRLLLNFRVDPALVSALLPAPFRPQLVRSHAVAGICLLRLRQLRPRALPAWLGLTSENAAHRIAVEWEDAAGATRSGVWIPHRDTGSVLNAMVGGRLYPGPHRLARFRVEESDERVRVAYRARDGATHVRATIHPTVDLGGELFADVDEASDFF